MWTLTIPLSVQTPKTTMQHDRPRDRDSWYRFVIWTCSYTSQQRFGSIFLNIVCLQVKLLGIYLRLLLPIRLGDAADGHWGYCNGNSIVFKLTFSFLQERSTNDSKIKKGN